MPNPVVALGAASVGSSLLGSRSASSAAKSQAKAAGQAADSTLQLGQETNALNKEIYDKNLAFNKQVYDQNLAFNKEVYAKNLDFSKQVYDETTARNEPARKLGQAALAKMSERTWVAAPTLEQFTADPGYQFRKSEGENAMNRQASASGLRVSGSLLKGMGNYNSGLASQEYGTFYNRYMDRMNNEFNKLASISGSGQIAGNAQDAAGQNYASASGNAGSNYGSATTNVNMNTASGVGNAYMAQGQARASGYTGQNAAIQSGLSGLGSTIGAAQSGILGANPGFGIKPSASNLALWGYA